MAVSDSPLVSPPSIPEGDVLISAQAHPDPHSAPPPPVAHRRGQRLRARAAQERAMFTHANSLLQRMIPDRSALVHAFAQLTGIRARGEANARSVRIRHLIFEFDTLPAAFHGFRILHLTDLHIDGVPGLTERVCEQVRAHEVDVCVLTGDYRFGGPWMPPTTDHHAHLEQIMANVRAREGIIGILGNHDASDDAEALERMGVRMLINEAVEIRRDAASLWIGGVDDPHAFEGHNLEHAFEDAPESAFKILLAHAPSIFEEASAHGVRLYLCGHTHGGQVCIPGLGPIVTGTKAPRRFATGVWRHKHVQGFTSNGIGTSGTPLRFFCPPEIGLIELRRKGEQNH